MSLFARTVRQLGPSGMKFGLERMSRHLSALGNPQDQFSVVHVAGTNGKGSVCAMLASVLKEAQLTVGLYTSPHLERYNERFQINGRSISDRDLNRLTQKIISAAGRQLTEFEFLTAIAFLWFAEQKVNVAVIEVGLGGRLDATNVVKNVLATVITTIDLDHTDWLGKTIEKIASEKAGIIKCNVPVITGARGGALRVIRKAAHAKQAPISVVHASTQAGTPPALKGPHQRQNTAVALATIAILSQRIAGLQKHVILRGLRKTVWPGRYERFGNIILDGAHNPAAIRELLKTLHENRIQKFSLLFAALRDKDVSEMIQLLRSHVIHGVVTEVPSPRTARAIVVAKHTAWKTKMLDEKNIDRALLKARRLAGTRPLVVTGSLYLIGEIRKRVRKGRV